MKVPKKLALLACLSLGHLYCETAVSAYQLSDSIGVNIHLGFGGTVYYDNFPLVFASLKDLGIKHVRDGLLERDWTGDTYYAHHQALAAAGIRCDFITSINQSPQLIQAYPAKVLDMEAIEAPNEYDASGDPHWAVDLLNYLPTIYSAVHTSPALSRIPIFGPSLVDENWWQSNNSYAQVGPVGALFTYSNLHNYQGGRNPGTPGWTPQGYGSIRWAMSNATETWSSNPIVTTEIGYINDPTITDSVPESVSAAYLPRVILEQFISGIQRTYLYELADNQFSGGSYGLLRSNGAPKPAYTALKTLHSLLQDSNAPAKLANLDFALSGDTDNVQHLLVQKSSGALLLFLWIELPRYNPDTKLSTPVPGRSIELNLSSSAKVVGTTHIQEDGTPKSFAVASQNGKIQININDRLTAVQIHP